MHMKVFCVAATVATGYLPSAEQAVDALQEAGVDEVVVLQEQANRTALYTCSQHEGLQVISEGLQAVAPWHTRGKHLDEQLSGLSGDIPYTLAAS